ncbi:MAG: cupredoxin domain-containing protein [Dehalococcoidia bacterium]
MRWTRRKAWLVAPAVAALAVAGVVSGANPRQTAGAQPAEAVTIRGFAFAPASLTVGAGTTIEWTNLDGAIPHTVTSGAPGAADAGAMFDSGTLRNGDVFSKTLAPGTYPYFCSIHNNMRGTVEVKAPPQLSSPPPPPATGPFPIQFAPAPVTSTSPVPVTSAAPVAAQPAIPNVTVTARDFSFDLPATIPAGLTSITLKNEGPEPHHAQLARLNDGVALDDFFAALRQGPDAALPLLSFLGGPAVVEAGGTQEVIVDLTEGAYVMLCFVEGADHVPHLAKGMIQPFRVTGSDRPRPADPTADAEVIMSDFTFSPLTIKAGPTTVKVTNVGPQVHEWNVLRLADGKTIDDLGAYIAAPSGPPPATSAGGFQGIDAGMAGWAKMDLAPGSFVAVCFVPDPASGKPHVQLGMIAPFEVR